MVVFFTSCTQKEDLIPKEICSEYTEVYNYKGNYYALDFREYSDESIEFIGDTTSADFKTIYNVMQKPDLSILTFSDEMDVTYLFDSPDLKEEFLSGIRKPMKSTLKSTSTWHPLYVRCYGNPGFNYMLFDASDPYDGITPTHYNTGNWDGFPRLSYVNGVNFNDLMSSIQILNYTGMEAEVALFSNAAFSGYNWTIYCRPSSVNGTGDSNQDDGYKGNNTAELGDFSERTMYYWAGLIRVNWDNKVSSIKWRTIDCVGECQNY